MFKNYIKIAFRNLFRNASFSLINILGLAVGIASSMIIFLFARYELTYDSFHERGDRIYRVTFDETQKIPKGGRHLATTAAPTGPALVETFPEVQKAVRLRFSEGDVISTGEKSFYENRVIYADSTFFEVFSFGLKLGNPKTALSAPNFVVLTQEMAAKYFGDENPIGRELEMNNEHRLQVTGVLEDTPRNSHLSFDFLISFVSYGLQTGRTARLERWEWLGFHNYVLLAPGADPANLESKLPEFISTHRPNRENRFDFRLQPLKDIYFGPVKNSSIASGNRAFPYGLIVVGLLILFLVSANYINLSTIRSFRRSKEVGLRKVVGASRKRLVMQFLGESILLSLFGFLVALILVETLFEALQEFVGLEISISGAEYLFLFSVGFILSLFVGIVAGSYPAFFTASFNPVKVLKGQLQSRLSGLTIRKILVAMQFCITIGLIAATLIVSRQLQFIRNKDLGFEKDKVVVLPMIREGSDVRYTLLRDRLLQNPYVVGISAGSARFDGDNGNVPMMPEGTDEGIPVNIYGVKYDFFKVLDIKLSQGRVFSESFPSDQTEAIILNKSAASILGWDDPVGKQVRLLVRPEIDGKVIGVVEDFHFASLHNEIKPLALYMKELIENVYVKIRPGDLRTILASLESDWKQVAPDLPWHFIFLDEHVARLYETEQQFSRLISTFSLLAIIIALLGLYALTAYVTQQRFREIGIRKVLGAGLSDIVNLLSKEFVKLVLAANLIAWPIAYLAMNKWLQGFAYRVDISLWVFALSGGVALVIALLTVSTQAIKAALSNPVNALRYE